MSIRQDLTPIDNDKTVNISDPTHIPIQRLKVLVEHCVSLRGLVKRIPKTPGSGLVQAHQRGLLSREQKRWYYSLSDEKKEPSSVTLRRVDVGSPFKTIVTVISPLDSRFGGEMIHPYENRLLSLKEIRRAQGVPDSFLLVGSLSNKVELVGNGECLSSHLTVAVLTA
jgi:DNA (cytosine-5)-methyltransferase 1